MKLKDNDTLKDSPIVANSAMNRERNIQGTNSYSKDLGFDILAFLKERQPVKWLDLCCGTGKALIEAAKILIEAEIEFSITGVDLISMFAEILPSQWPAKSANFLLLEADLSTWKPTEDEKFDLITCVHGLHYIGDKLDLISRAVSWLKPDGVFRANLDLKSLRLWNKQISARVLRRKGLEYNSKTHILSCEGSRDAVFSQFTYLGADDEAGPNYTCQPAVNSHYKRIKVTDIEYLGKDDMLSH